MSLKSRLSPPVAQVGGSGPSPKVGQLFRAGEATRVNDHFALFVAPRAGAQMMGAAGIGSEVGPGPAQAALRRARAHNHRWCEIHN